MFLRRLQQTRNGRSYVYFSLVETVRSPAGAVRQRTSCYLGRLDNLRPPDWLRIAARLPDPAWLPRLQQEVGYVRVQFRNGEELVFQRATGRPHPSLTLRALKNPSLGAQLRNCTRYVPPPPGTGTVATVAVIPTSISWCRPRRLGDISVALRAWQHLGLDRLLQRLLQTVATRVPMAHVAALIAVNRLIDPRSERGLYSWIPSTALPELLDFRRDRLSLNQLYRCLSLVEPHKQTIENHLAEQARDLFHFQNELLL